MCPAHTSCVYLFVILSWPVQDGLSMFVGTSACVFVPVHVCLCMCVCVRVFVPVHICPCVGACACVSGLHGACVWEIREQRGLDGMRTSGFVNRTPEPGIL